MIDPNTPPGTKIVCINNKGNLNVLYPNNPFVKLEKYITENCIYTVSKISKEKLAKSGFKVLLEEVNYFAGFDISRFKYLELPKEILECLNVSKIPVKIADEVLKEDIRDKELI